MSAEETLPNLHRNPKSAKNAIVQKLSTQWPLSAKQLSNALQREYALNISYQAVRKALQELEKEHVVEKNTKGYQLDERWIKDILQISQSIAQNYERNEPLTFDQDVVQLHFNSWVNMGRFGAFTFKDECPNPEGKPIITAWMHVWPVSTVSAEESKKLVAQAKRESGLYCISPNNTPLDQLFADWISKLGRQNKLGAKIAMDHDFVIRGDHIAQFYYESEFWKKLDAFYKENTDIKHIDYQKLQELATEKTNIHVVVLRNKELAEAKRKEILAMFKKKL